MRPIARAALAASASLVLTAGVSNAQTTVSFGLWGDMPYAKADDAPHIPALLDDMNASGIAFSVYDGDIKDGSSECTDQIYTDALAMFGTLKMPVIYVPGDNEWTDCHRTNNGSYNSLERLDHIRTTMFTTAGTLGQSQMDVVRQGEPGQPYVENVRLSIGGATIIGLNVPGSNNGKVNDADACANKSERTAEECDADNAEWAERDAMNIEWLTQGFAAATAAGDKGVMIVIQGDPGFDIPETEDDDESRLPGKEGYAAFLDAVITQSSAFDGQVVLVHGDTHFFKIDRPLTDATHLLSNFTRVQTFGSPNIHWIQVDVDPASRDVFTFHPMIVAANAGVGQAG